MPSDVVIIGAGPVGLTAALLLAGHGLRVDIVEKQAKSSNGGRAVALDDEGLRIWQTCGLSEILREDWGGGEVGQCVCSYLDERGRAFLRIRQRLGEFGHPHAVVIHEGRIGEKLLRAVERHARIRLRNGAVERIEQEPDRVRLLGTLGDGRPLEMWAPWVIGCDGASGVVRQQLGIPMRGTEIPHPWLVANLVDRGEPGHVTIRCRARGAAVTMPLPHGMRRVEVQLDPGDAGAWLGDEAEVRRRLRLGWDGAADAPLAHVAICRFRAAIAERWRDRRVFLAGDAAHVTPPFAGQGLGAGLRDVANLAFKLAGVCQGWLAAPVLETYEVERRPHVERMIRLACRLGRLMAPRSARGGAVVHAAVRLLASAPVLGDRWLLRGPRIAPTLTSGFVVPADGAGRYLPQPMVIAADHRQVMLDELLGPRMTWIVLGGRPGAGPRLRSPLLQPSDTVLMEGRDFRDPGRVLSRHFGAGSLVLVRPDRVVYCHIRPTGHRSTAARSLACRPDTIALRQVREVASSAPRSSSLLFPDVSRTAPILSS